MENKKNAVLDVASGECPSDPAGRPDGCGKTVSVIIPFLNEEQNLPELHRRLAAVFASLPENLHMIFVDDGSTDGSVEWVKNQRERDSRIDLIVLSRDFGHQMGITAGLDHCHADAAVIIDSDLQDPPEVITELIEKWRAGYEVVYAVRKKRKGEVWFVKFCASVFYKVFRAMAKVDVPLNAGDFRLVDRSVVEALRQIRESHRFMRGLTCWVGFRQCAVEYERDPRNAGTTKYPLLHRARLAFDAMTSFSASPLRWTVGFGLIACALAMIWFLQILLSTLFGHPDVRGWASIIAAIVFMGGVQLVSIGVLGQYLSRTFEETKKRPLYFIRETTLEGQA